MSKHNKSRRLTTESMKELSEIDRSQTKHALLNPKDKLEQERLDKIFYKKDAEKFKQNKIDKEREINRRVDGYMSGIPSYLRMFPNLKRAKGINCSPCTIKAMSRLRVQLATMKKKKSSSDDIMDRFEHFLERKPKTKGVSGVFDPSGMRILDANIPSDSMRLQNLFGNKNSLIGFNSITDTRLGPAKDPNLIRKQLREIESRGGIPALGFDEGSLEAVEIATGTKDEHILKKLLPHQRSTGILDPKNKFRIVQNPNFSLTWK